jgi:selenide,water dikinase
VLRALAERPLGEARVTLVAPAARHTYSGMLPGVVAGHYRLEEAQIDLARLAVRAGVELIPERLRALDAATRTAICESGRRVGFDVASLNLGSVPSDAGVPGAAQHAAAAKPIEPFLERWEAARRSARRIAVVGAGAAGVEMAMAIRHRLPETAVALYSDRPMFSGSLALRIGRALERSGVQLLDGIAVRALEPGPVVVSAGAWSRYDFVLWTAGAAPLPWLRGSGLAADGAGFVLVDRTLRSVSHPAIFAVGDCATLRDAPHPRSGVYAVRHGAVLAENLFRTLRKEEPVRYEPQKNSLILLSCGAKYAIASRGGWSAEGAWAWRWKDRIDRRWIARFG